MAEEAKEKPIQLEKSDDPMINAIRALKKLEKRLRDAITANNVIDAMLAIEELQENKVKVSLSLHKPEPAYVPDPQPVSPFYADPYAFNPYASTICAQNQPLTPELFMTLQAGAFPNPYER